MRQQQSALPRMYEGPPVRTTGPAATKRVVQRADREPISPLVLFGIPLLCVLGGSLYLRAHPEALPESQLKQFEGLKQHVQKLAEQAKQQFLPDESDNRNPAKSKSAQKKPRPAPPAAPLKHPVTLYLTNGEIVIGDLLRETPQHVILQWGGGEVTFLRKEILQLHKDQPTQHASASMASTTTSNAPASAAQPQDVTLYLKNGRVVTGPLVYELPDELVLRWDYGDVRFARTDIERLVRPTQDANANGMMPP